MAFIYLALTLFMGGAIALSWRIWQTKRHFQPLQAAPSPPKHWLLGNIPQISAAIKKKQLFKQFWEWSQQYGSAYVIWSVEPVLILSKPTVIENTIVNEMRDGSLVRSKKAQQAWNDISGPILLGTGGAEWKWRRKAWNLEFSTSGLETYVRDVQPACAQVIEKLKQAGPTTAIQLDPLFVELTMRVISLATRYSRRGSCRES
ncbi:MAG: cytochrome P450 [Cyanobacteria bacterium P01_F01_bin.53]